MLHRPLDRRHRRQSSRHARRSPWHGTLISVRRRRRRHRPLQRHLAEVMVDAVALAVAEEVHLRSASVYQVQQGVDSTQATR